MDQVICGQVFRKSRFTRTPETALTSNKSGHEKVSAFWIGTGSDQGYKASYDLLARAHTDGSHELEDASFTIGLFVFFDLETNESFEMSHFF